MWQPHLSQCHCLMAGGMPVMPEPRSEPGMRASPSLPANRPGGGQEQGSAPAGAGSNLLFLREEEIRLAQDVLFFAYRDFTQAADIILTELELGRAHHRALHFIGRNP